MRLVSKLVAMLALGSAPAAFAQSTPAEAPSSAVQPRKAATPVVNKWDAQLYGFAEVDAIQDTRQSMTEVPGNPVLPTPGSYAAQHGRLQLSIRNSRLGFRLASPEFRGMKGSGLIETDFFGNQPNASGGGSESAFYNNAGLRVRHAWAKLDAPGGVAVLGGQTWQLFGWQPYFHPNTVELQGVPGQVYSRTAQFRLSETIKTDPVTLELAIAAARPPQRDADLPDGQAGVRVAFNDWKGVRTSGGTGTGIDPAMIGVSGVLRGFQVQKPGQADPNYLSKTSGWGVSIDGLLPIIPGKADDRSNALTATGSWVRGAGIQDMYSGFSNGVGSATAPTGQPGGSTGPQSGAGSAGLDGGLVAFNSANNLTAVQVRSFIVGVQYYTPIDNGAVWVSGNYSQTNSDNAADLTSPTTQVFKRQRWAEGALFWDATQAIRFGGAFGWFEDQLRDGSLAHNQRYQLSMWYLF